MRPTTILLAATAALALSGAAQACQSTTRTATQTPVAQTPASDVIQLAQGGTGGSGGGGGAAGGPSTGGVDVGEGLGQSRGSGDSLYGAGTRARDNANEDEAEDDVSLGRRPVTRQGTMNDTDDAGRIGDSTVEPRTEAVDGRGEDERSSDPVGTGGVRPGETPTRRGDGN